MVEAKVAVTKLKRGRCPNEVKATLFCGGVLAGSRLLSPNP